MPKSSNNGAQTARDLRSDSGRVENREYITIAVDGPAASGKGSLARSLAQHFGLSYLDTGEMYRKLAATYSNSATISYSLVNSLLMSPTSIDLKNEKIARLASVLARNPQVRSLLVEMQREFAYSQLNGAVLDGRDIASTVLPNADYKIFVTAKPFIRAKRRFLELRSSSRRQIMMYRQVFFTLLQRDVRDRRRSVSPLICTKQSILFDNSYIGKTQTFEQIIKKVKSNL